MYIEMILDFSNVYRILFDRSYAPRGYLIDLCIDGIGLLHIEESYTALLIKVFIAVMVCWIIKKLWRYLCITY